MAVELTITETVEISKICQYLASNEIDFDKAFNGGTSLEGLADKIKDVRKGLEWAYDQNYIAASAKAQILISGTIEVGKIIEIVSPDYILGDVVIGTYTIVSGDTTTTILATHVAAAITGYGYTGASNGALDIITAPFVLGNLMNTRSLIVNYDGTTLDFTISEFVGGVSVAEQAAWDADLRNIANYLFRLCNYYVFKASGIVANNSGNTIYNPTTGQLLSGLIPVDYQFTVGDQNTPMDVTNTIMTITDQRIIAGSLNVHVDGVETPNDLTAQVSVDPIYSPAQIVATFNQALQVGQVVKLEYFKGGQASSTAGKISQSTLYYTVPADTTTITFGELVGVPLADLRLVFRSGTIVRPVSGATADSTQVQYDGGIAGIFTAPTGDTFIQDSQFTVDYVS